VNLANNLRQGLHALQLKLSDSTQTQLLNYLELLVKWNRVYNLTAVRDMAQMIPKHILDSLAVLPYCRGTQILDVGTGAGLPGLILAIARPDWQCVLLDSNAKKIRFVRQAIIELEIKNALAECTRIELFNPQSKFSTVISRAYTTLHRFYTQTARLCTGSLLAMKGVYPEAEMAQMARLPVHLETFPLQVPQLAAQRHLIVMQRSNDDKHGYQSFTTERQGCQPSADRAMS
jgi:16S rRNA (guanine527-N7)-methyltransferase